MRPESTDRIAAPIPDRSSVHVDRPSDYANASAEHISNPVISLKNVSKRYGERRALHSLSFDLPEGSVLVIFGANGAGKTTLLRLLSLLERPTEGELNVFGLNPQKDGDGIRSQLGLISHQPMLYLDLTAEENLLLFARLSGIADPHQRVAEMLEGVRLTHRRNDRVRGFSRGMLQRLAIARALLPNPSLVLLDEPYTGLDASAREVADRLFLAGHDEQAGGRSPEETANGVRSPKKTATASLNRTVVITSHDLDRGYRVASHVLLLSRGKPLVFAPRGEITFDDLATLYQEQLKSGGA